MRSKLSKAFVLLLSFAIMATQFIVPTFAVGQNECTCDENTRTGTFISSVAPTCADFGYDIFECNECHGTFIKLTAEATGLHDYVDHDAQAPTCTEIGWDAYQTCSNCDYTTYVEKPALGHDYHDAVTAPTCTEQGYTTHTCSRCGDEYVDTYTNPLGHTASSAVEENRVEATCETDGSYDSVIYCSVCGIEFIRNTLTIPATGHDFQETDRTEPGCTTGGYIDYECSVCHQTKHEDLPPVPGLHDYAITIVDANCTEAVKKIYTCKVCGYSFEESVGEPLGHAEVIDEAVAPTCLETGLTEGKHCSRCNAVLVPQNEVPALGHDYVSTVVAPTCSAEGYTIHTCSRCGDSYTDTPVAIDPLSHRVVISKDEVKATCTTTGLTYELKCGDCGKLLAAQKETPIDPDNHDYVSVVTEPTCLTDGYTTHTCSRCGHNYIDANVAALGHDLIHHEAKDPTCTEIGWYEYDTCSRCDYSTYVEIAALGHDYDAVVTDPTCTENGYTTHTCSRCQDSYIDNEVDALGHRTCETIGTVEATCTEKGYTVKKCLICDTIFKDDFVDELGHDLTHHDALDPTCTEIGWDAYDTCSRCDYTTYVEKAALGHDMVNISAKDATCTEIGWDEYSACSRCDHTDGYNEHAALGHDLTHYNAQDATCTEIGWDAYDTCSRCDYTTYVEKAALGHDITHHDAKDPTCTEIGWEAYDSCSRGDYSTYVEKAALGHNVVIDEGKEATFDETGLTEGKHCSVCGEIIVAQTVIPRKQEEITFTYEATGINGSSNAVNSGFVTLKVYMNVNTEIARLWGADIDINFSNFLTLLSVDGCIFEQSLSTPLDVANSNYDVKLTQDMGFSTAKTFTNGTYLFATLTFKVDKNSYSQDASFEVLSSECTVARDSEVLKNELVADFGNGAQIHVNMLGDADGDGKITSSDNLLLSKWFAYADLDSYDTVYDMNKDGYVDGADFALLRGAIVRDDSYLDI